MIWDIDSHAGTAMVPGWEHFSPSVGLFYSLNGTDLRCRGSFRVR